MTRAKTAEAEMMTPYALISPAQVEPLHPAAIAGVEETEAAAAEVEAVEWSGAEQIPTPFQL